MNIKKCNVIGFVFVLLFGSFMHFAYDLSGQNPLIALVAPVNESSWEHLKLLFFPSLIFMIYEYFIYGKSRKDFFAVKMTSILSGMMFILVFFYTYSGILGFNLFVLDILDFILADALGFYISYYFLMSTPDGDRADSVKGVAVLFIVALCFLVWTNNPPDLGVFWG